MGHSIHRRAAAALIMAGMLLPASHFSRSAGFLDTLSIARLHELGFTGQGVRIAVVGTGFETSHPAFSGVTVVGQRDFVSGDDVVGAEPGDPPDATRRGTAAWSLMAARVGSFTGVAPDAEYLLARTDDVRFQIREEEDNLIDALIWAAENGADVIVSTVAYVRFDDGFAYLPEQLNGDIVPVSRTVDSLAGAGILVVMPVGDPQNTQPTLAPPADADFGLAVGAVDSLNEPAPFSGGGPTQDGRIKPDLTAPGVAVTALDVAANDLVALDGLDLATALVGGAAALMLQVHPTLTPAEIIRAFRKDAVSNRPTPENRVGWGTPDVNASATFPTQMSIDQPAASDLATITPTIAWTHADIAPFAQPVSYRVRLFQDLSFTGFFFDTVVDGTSTTVTEPLPPRTRFAIEVTAEGANGESLAERSSGLFMAPEWVVLTRLDDPAGITIRDPRPNFRWASPSVATPPGPFVYTIRIIRVEDAEIELEVSGIDSTAFTPPNPLETNTPYRWSIEGFLLTRATITDSRGTFVIIDDSAPPATLLFQNFPNPFPNPGVGLEATCIWFDLARSQSVRLDILDLRGHPVRNLVPSAGFPSVLSAGRYGRPLSSDPGRCDPKLEWDGTDSEGRNVPRGIYLVRLTTREGVFFKRIVYLGAGE